MKTRRHKKGLIKRKFTRNIFGGSEQAKYDMKRIDTDFKDKLNAFVVSKSNMATEKQMKMVHEMYDQLAEKIKGESDVLKNLVNNIIDYASSKYYSRFIEHNVEQEDLSDAFARRNLLIDQFTRLNTIPNVDPFLERIISTFWPKANTVKYKRPPTKIINKETLIETKFYPTISSTSLKVDKKNEAHDKKTYGRKIMSINEKVNGDQSDYDTLGVEMFLNTLLSTGSNVSNVPPEAYKETYLIEEKLDNSAYVSKET